MNYTTILLTLGTLFIAVFTVRVVMKFYFAYTVPQGYVGLLYNQGRFVKLLSPGRHILWGLYYSINLQDVRKASLLVPGQDVLTSDNVGVKLSVLITYQM